MQVFVVGGGVIDAGSKISMSTNAETDEASLPERILILSPFPRAAIFLNVLNFSTLQNKTKKNTTKLHAQNMSSSSCWDNHNVKHV